MKNQETGLGKYIYSEWLFPIKDYYCSIRKNEIVFEIVIPALCAVGCTLCYLHAGKIYNALGGLANLLPTAISILIGFTVMLITLLLTSNSENVNNLKEVSTFKMLYKEPTSLYQGLHIQFSHSLFSEVVLLLLVFCYLFWHGLGVPIIIAAIFLVAEIYLTLNILLSVLRGITSLYFSFYYG